MSTTTFPDPASPSYNERLLAHIRPLLLDKALDDVAEYEIQGRRLTKIPLADLRKWKASIESRVRREPRRKKGLPQRFIPVIFGQADVRQSRLRTTKDWLDQNAAYLGLLLGVIGMLLGVAALVMKTGGR